jgi:hypothetical protein
MATETVETPEQKAKALALETAQKTADAENAKRVDEAGKPKKGTRIRVGQTRGRNTQVVSWEAFDDSLPETLPKSYAEFAELTGVTSEEAIVSILVDGFNQQAYVAASDPIADFVNPVWPEEVQKGFRLVVRNYAANTGVSIEDAVALVKPGIDKVHGQKK